MKSMLSELTTYYYVAGMPLYHGNKHCLEAKEKNHPVRKISLQRAREKHLLFCPACISTDR